MSYTVKRLGHLGDGIIAAEGFDIYAPFTLPGEVIDGPLQADRIENARILSPSPDRVKAPCAHFRQCGGCLVQHASDKLVADWKVGIVQNALMAHQITAEVSQGYVALPSTRRRATLSARRTKKGAMVGFHRRGSDQIVEVPGCKILRPEILESLPLLEALTKRFASRKGVMTFQVTATEAGLDLVIRGAELTGAKAIEDLVEIVGETSVARVSQDGEVILKFRDPTLTWDGITTTPPPGGFLQATTESEAHLIDFAKSATKGCRNIADLFSGAGTFTLPLARSAEVTAFESEASAIDALLAGWRQGENLKTVTANLRDLFRAPLDAAELSRFDAVVIDPPRSGAAAQCHELAQSAVPVIAFISCNPQTFARDAAQLIKGGYRMGPVEVIDQFRWSGHVELVARFTK